MGHVRADLIRLRGLPWVESEVGIRTRNARQVSSEPGRVFLNFEGGDKDLAAKVSLPLAADPGQPTYHHRDPFEPELDWSSGAIPDRPLEQPLLPELPNPRGDRRLDALVG